LLLRRFAAPFILHPHQRTLPSKQNPTFGGRGLFTPESDVR
jgi:hypothetical protein